jgi:hypothetical protein
MMATMGSAQEPGSQLRTTVTRVHAILLFVITIAATTASTLGWKGRGPLDVLASQPLGYVGLFQAYFLMFLLALVCLIGATRWPSRLWNAALLVAHLGPVLIIVIAHDVFVSVNAQHMSYVMALVVHVPLMLLEAFALLWKVRQAPALQRHAAGR